MLQTSYDLFKGKLNDNPIWIGTSELLDEGIEKLESAADGEPGEYFLYNGCTGLVVATLQKLAAGPTRIIRYWTWLEYYDFVLTKTQVDTLQFTANSKWAMAMKEWVATYKGCQIRVPKAWFGAAQIYKLYIDGDWRDTNVDTLVSSHSPALSVRVTPAKLQPFLVEVYVKARVTVRIKICVDGKQVGGDTF